MKFLVDFVNSIVNGAFSILKIFFKLCGYALICLIIMSFADKYFSEHAFQYTILIIFVFIFMFQRELLHFNNKIRIITNGVNSRKKIKSYNSNSRINNTSIADSKNIEKVNLKVNENIEVKKEPFEHYIIPTINIVSDSSLEFKDALSNIDRKNILNVGLGIDGEKVIYESILNFPNMLIGGTIATGKTSFINSILCFLLMNEKPQNLRLIICDSKRVDYSIYKDIPHLITPIISDVQKLKIVLRKITSEIDSRYEVLHNSSKKNIRQYNEQESIDQIPYILLIIDELTSFTSMDEEINEYLEKISQIGWTVGVHSIIAVNHPSSKIISTIAKGNFPTRVAFKTTSMQDSRMILDDAGAEKLLGIGNILYSTISDSRFKKLSTILIDDEDINEIVKFISNQKIINENKDFGFRKNKVEDEYDDPMYNEVVEFVVVTGAVSASLLQRKFRLGYNRAARLVDLLEERGIIGPANGSKPREVLVKLED